MHFLESKETLSWRMLSKTWTTKPKKKRAYLEELEQERFFQWVHHKFPELENLIFAIPNGGSRSKKAIKARDGSTKYISIEGARLKRQGVKAGILDVFISIASSPYHGAYIEFKSPSIKNPLSALSTEQKRFKKLAEENGYLVIVVNTFEDAKNRVLEYLKNHLGV
jgi:hypothetical protein